MEQERQQRLSGCLLLYHDGQLGCLAQIDSDALYPLLALAVEQEEEEEEEYLEYRPFVTQRFCSLKLH